MEHYLAWSQCDLQDIQMLLHLSPMVSLIITNDDESWMLSINTVTVLYFCYMAVEGCAEAMRVTGISKQDQHIEILGISWHDQHNPFHSHTISVCLHFPHVSQITLIWYLWLSSCSMGPREVSFLPSQTKKYHCDWNGFSHSLSALFCDFIIRRFRDPLGKTFSNMMPPQ